MPKESSHALPPALLELLDGRELERKVGDTLELLTVSEDGWPRVALLSVGEALAISETELRLALWPASTTTANLGRSGRATLACVLAGTAYSVRLGATRMPRGAGSLACFACRVELVESDTVDYAQLESGIRFRLEDASGTVEVWRRTLEALRAG